MAADYKVLAQLIPSAATATTLYTVPSSTSTVISSIVFNNTNTAYDTVRVAIRPAGESLANKHYVFYDTVVQPTQSILATVGLTLAATDVVTVYSTLGYASFQIFGTEIS
jgi:hypothetical protein